MKQNASETRPAATPPLSDSGQCVRLQKALRGLVSRRGAEQLIVAGRVAVNGQVIRALGTVVSETDVITVDGRCVDRAPEAAVYVILNKPRRVMSTAADDRGRRTVIDLIGDVDKRIYPVGRLDYDSEGLLLLTNDGELMNRLLHPRQHVDKTYRVVVQGRVDEAKLDRLRVGVELDDGKTAPAEIHLIDGLAKNERIHDHDHASKKKKKEGDNNNFAAKNFFQVEITIHEGRNRQIRRMFAAIGYEVKRLRRVKFAGLTLDGLRVGEHRQLTASEIKMLRKITNLTFNEKS